MLATTGDVGIYWTNKWNWRHVKSYELPDSFFVASRPHGLMIKQLVISCDSHIRCQFVVTFDSS